MVDLIIGFLGEKAEDTIEEANDTKKNDEGGRKQSHDKLERIGHFK